MNAVDVSRMEEHQMKGMSTVFVFLPSPSLLYFVTIIFLITCEWKKLYGPKINGRLLCVVDELYVQVWLILSLCCCCCCCCCLLCSLQPLFTLWGWVSIIFFNLDYEQVTKWWEIESELTKPKRILFIFRFNISCKQKAFQNL